MPDPRPADRTANTTPRASDSAPRSTDSTGDFPPPLPADAPERVGRYEVRAVLGEGACGRVYRGFDPKLDREVAIKLPRVEDRAPDLRERFLREARAAAAVHHPNVCPIYDVETDGDRPYLVMRYVAGGTLAGVLAARAAPFDPAEAAGVVRRVALGVAAAHARGVLHRDLKPANVLWDAAAGEVLVADFGLARAAGAAQLSRTGDVLGTPAYMSPEQARGRTGEVGPPADVYSLGVILYRLLAGVLPFTGTVMEVLTQAQFDAPVPPSAHRPGLDPRLDALCLKALAKAPADRFPTAREFADALADLPTPPVAAPPPPPPPPPPPQPPPPPPRGGLRWLAAPRCVAVFDRHAAPVRAAAFGRDGARVLTTDARAADDDRGTARVWDATTGVEVGAVRDAVRGAAGLDPAGALVVFAGARGAVVQEAATGRVVHRLAGWSGHALAAGFDRGGTRVFVAGATAVGVWDAATGALVAMIDPPRAGFASAALRPDGGAVATADGADRTARVWCARTGRRLAACAGHPGYLGTVVFAPDGARLATAGADPTVRVWDAATGDPVAACAGHADQLTAVAFGPTGATLVTASYDKTARVWDAATGAERARLSGGGWAVYAAAVSPDGARVATGGNDKTARLWDAATGEPAAVLGGHAAAVRVVAFSPDGTHLVTAGDDRTARVWHVAERP